MLNIKPNIKAILPDKTIANKINIQLYIGPKIILHNDEITKILVAHGINGIIRIEIICSFLLLLDLDNIIAGTLQPNAVNKFIIDRPEIPNLLKALSNRIDTLDNKPICWIIAMHICKIKIGGINAIIINKPPNIPSTNILLIQLGTLMNNLLIQ